MPIMTRGVVSYTNYTYEWVTSHMNESCHEWVLAHVWMSSGTRMNESDSFVTVSCDTNECFICMIHSWHVTHSWQWLIRDSVSYEQVVRDTSLIHMAWHERFTSHHVTRHDSFCVTWLIHICDMFCVWHDSFTPVTWLLISYSYERITMCDMTCVVFIRDTVTNESLSRMSHVSRMTHHSFAWMRHVTSHTRRSLDVWRDMTHAVMAWLVYTCNSYVIRLFMRWLIPVCRSYVTRLTRMNESFHEVWKRLVTYVMTCSCVSFVCNKIDAYGRVISWSMRESCHIRDDSFMCVIRMWQDVYRVAKKSH